MKNAEQTEPILQSCFQTVCLQYESIQNFILFFLLLFYILLPSMLQQFSRVCIIPEIFFMTKFDSYSYWNIFDMLLICCCGSTINQKPNSQEVKEVIWVQIYCSMPVLSKNTSIFS